MKTRKQYINNECTFFEFYSQFVTNYELANVSNNIGLDRILKSKDEHLNDIPLKQWDNLSISSQSLGIMRECGITGFSLSDAVCINKTAARMLIKSNET